MGNIGSIGLGTAAIGRPQYINLKEKAASGEFSLPEFRKSGIEILEDAYQKGIRYFDTSPGYGIAEDLLVNWLKGKNDKTIQVSSKWGYTYVANFDPNAKLHEKKEHSLRNLNKQWEQTRHLLPYLKLYQIHSATFDTGVLDNVEVLKRLHELKKENNIIIGLSTTGNNQTEVLEKALSVQVENEILFESYQCTFNILDQSVSKYQGELEALAGPFIIKEALANGRLVPNESFGHYERLYTLTKKLAEKYKVGADAIALRYSMESFPNALVLSGTNNSKHLDSNLKSEQFSLSESEVEELKSYGVESQDYWQERKQLTWN